MCTEIVFNCNVRVVKHKVSPMAVLYDFDGTKVEPLKSFKVVVKTN